VVTAEGDAMRVGNGFDVHPWSDDPARTLVLGGVSFADERGLAGHSDADVVAHACTDALLGAAGLGDIGALFPDTDDRWRDADSVGLLAEAARQVRAAGWEPQNVDCTVVLDTPKLAPARDEMQRRLGEAVGAPVTVKGKRTEGVGALGRGEGIVAWAVALVAQRSA
jgi:2-C-methyl-D-erythritol 2,4-cyclodiphosphate synthase